MIISHFAREYQFFGLERTFFRFLSPLYLFGSTGDSQVAKQEKICSRLLFVSLISFFFFFFFLLFSLWHCQATRISRLFQRHFVSINKFFFFYSFVFVASFYASIASRLTIGSSKTHRKIFTENLKMDRQKCTFYFHTTKSKEFVESLTLRFVTVQNLSICIFVR